MPLELDIASWPVVVLVRPTAGSDGTAGVDGAVGNVLGSLLDRRECFGLVLDLGRQSDDEQAAFAGWLRDNRVAARRYVVGCALVVPTAAVERGREMIGARPEVYPFPAWFAATRDECRSWVEGVLASSGPGVGRARRR